ncbi:flagellar biosynthetic protein FliR [Cellulomonas sp. B6]|jgi:flagellar biosynthetic protein FliR|uniref:flagellar biosynthetic protein FliR n=1 Tax=Cellulomonas sp. B6 TaxID=1295626 RepID=UPI00073C33E8|nr:flagellar biosynthetic protein FliR [Cellulomonas sp. B6]KSW29483.1 flagellar biosynthetic protein FliR [Cellulomonas sp. B6]
MDPVAVTLPIAAVETTLLAAVRMIAFLVVAPPFAQRGVPGPVKVALGTGLALAVAPRLDPVESSGTAALFGGLVLQAVVGAGTGFLVYLVFAAVQSAGSLIDLFGGFQVATAFDPMSMTSGAQFSRLYQLLAVVLLFASDGYQMVVAGLLRTFDVLPVGVMFSAGGFAQGATDGITNLFVSALQIAGPLLVVLFLADVGLGLLTRVSPALNAFALGFPLKILLTLTLCGFALLALPDLLGALAERAATDVPAVLR